MGRVAFCIESLAQSESHDVLKRPVFTLHRLPYLGITGTVPIKNKIEAAARMGASGIENTSSLITFRPPEIQISEAMNFADREMDASKLIDVLCDQAEFSVLPSLANKRGSTLRYRLLNTEGVKLQLSREHFGSLLRRWRAGQLSEQSLAEIGAFISLYDEVFSFRDKETESLFANLDHPDTDFYKLTRDELGQAA